MKKYLICILFSLSAMILSGEIVYSDSLLQSAQSGNISAQINLGYCYAEAKGIQRNMPEALKWLKLAADKGDPTAQYDLGLYLHFGIAFDIKPDFKEAVRLFRLSADQLNPDAQFMLGESYLNGTGTKKSYKDAFYWLYIASCSTNAKASHNAKTFINEASKRLTREQVNVLIQQANEWMINKTTPQE